MQHDKLNQVTTFCGEPCCTFADALAHIDQRDARIAELEAQAGDGTSSNKYCAELYDEVWQAALKAQQPSVGGAYSRDPLACSGCAAGCFRCRSSAGVADERAAFDEWFNDFSLSVRMNGGQMNDAQMFAAWQARAHFNPNPTGSGVRLPERKPDINRSFGGSDAEWYGNAAHNACLDEVARLNPCRAQSVTDERVAFEREAGRIWQDWGIGRDLNRGPDNNSWNGSGYYTAQTHLAFELWVAARAAPSAQQKESGDE